MLISHSVWFFPDSLGVALRDPQLNRILIDVGAADLLVASPPQV